MLQGRSSISIDFPIECVSRIGSYSKPIFMRHCTPLCLKALTLCSHTAHQDIIDDVQTVFAQLQSHSSKRNAVVSAPISRPSALESAQQLEPWLQTKRQASVFIQLHRNFAGHSPREVLVYWQPFRWHEHISLSPIDREYLDPGSRLPEILCTRWYLISK